MLSKEQQVFLDVLKCNVQGIRLESIPNDIDWNELIRIAKIQDMKALLALQVLPFLKSNENLKTVADDLYVSYAFAFCTYQKRLAILKKFDDAFSKESISYFVFKGTEISSYYDTPALRRMGDSDILVHEEDREKAHRLFLRLGMKNKCQGENEWIYYYDNMEFELHCRLMNEGEVGNYQSHKCFMNRRWDYAVNNGDSTQFHLDLSYHFVFVLLHLRKHFINSGVGFRQFMDLAVMMKKCELDWEFIMEEFDKMDLTQFAKTCFAFCSKWFGISAPVEYGELEEDFYECSTNKIFNNGVFGFEDEENENNYTILQLGENITKGKISMFFQYLFPPYDSIRKVPKYSFVDGKPGLLPIAWIYRVFYSVFHGTASVSTSQIKDKMSISGKEILKRKEYLEKWGLN